MPAEVAPNKLLDHLRREYNLKTDAALAKFLYTSPPTISRLRTDKRGLGAVLTLIIYDRTGLPISTIREWFKEGFI
jgi:hypothetical protein